LTKTLHAKTQLNSRNQTQYVDTGPNPLCIVYTNTTWSMKIGNYHINQFLITTTITCHFMISREIQLSFVVANIQKEWDKEEEFHFALKEYQIPWLLWRIMGWDDRIIDHDV